MTSIIFACDTVPPVGEDAIISEAPRDNFVPVFPRKIDLDNVEKLKKFEFTQIVTDMDMLQKAISMRLAAMP